MVPVYNCGIYLRETLESVLIQAPREADMQIEVVDDASTDVDVEALVKEIGQGRVKYYRQKQNVGSLKNFETCLNRSKGQWVHLLHGDDKVEKGYYKKIAELFKQFPEAGAAFSGFKCVDEKGKTVYKKKPEMQQDGILENWLSKISVHQRIQYAAITVKRDVYEKLGAFYNITYAEDWEMWVRIARNYSFAYTPEVLAVYRKHINSISASKILKGDYLKDLHQAMLMIQQHLPADQREIILAKSKKYYAKYALRSAKMVWNKLHNRKAVYIQVKQALKLHQSLELYLMVLKLFFSLKSVRS
ncbi:glycosyltransferase family 2 protein [Pontibacter sp. MBLB2868]|uniref:glycosyltransferase family 2 protein n=1 Tax=Pontibacter sp. MBLB2868 TaxID=3451555 RepID=UPI003F7503F3